MVKMHSTNSFKDWQRGWMYNNWHTESLYIQYRVYSVTPKPGIGVFLNIGNLQKYTLVLNVLLGQVFLQAVSVEIWGFPLKKWRKFPTDIEDTKKLMTPKWA